MKPLDSIRGQRWRTDAACAGSPHDFIDVKTLEMAEYLIRRYCHRCPVIAECGEWGKGEPRERWTSVYGGRLHGIGAPEPRVIA